MELYNILLVLLHLLLSAPHALCGQRLCGKVLADFVSSVCGERGYYADHGLRKRSLDNFVERGNLYSGGIPNRVGKISSDSNPFQEESEAKSFLGLSREKRRTGLIVTECCHNVCSYRIVESFCNPWPEEETTTMTTTTQAPAILPTDQREADYLTDDAQMEHITRGQESNSVDLLSEGSDVRDETPMPTVRVGGGRSPHIRHDQSADVDSGFHRFSDLGADVEESDSTIDNPSSDRQDPSSIRIDHEIPTTGPRHHDTTGSSRRGGGRSSRRRNNGSREGRKSRRRNRRKRPKRSVPDEGVNAEETMKQNLDDKSKLIKDEQLSNDKGLRRHVSIEDFTKRESHDDNGANLGYSLKVSDLPNLRPRHYNEKRLTEGGRSKKVKNIDGLPYETDSIIKRNQRILSRLLNPTRRLRYRIIALTGSFNPYSRNRTLRIVAKKESESPTLPR